MPFFRYDKQVLFLIVGIGRHKDCSLLFGIEMFREERQKVVFDPFPESIFMTAIVGDEFIGNTGLIQKTRVISAALDDPLVKIVFPAVDGQGFELEKVVFVSPYFLTLSAKTVYVILQKVAIQP